MQSNNYNPHVILYFFTETGRADFTVQYLISVENKAKETFSLTEKAASVWKKIGTKLGITTAELSTAEKTFESEEERLKMIWHMWYNRTEIYTSILFPGQDYESCLRIAESKQLLQIHKQCLKLCIAVAR